MKVAVVGGAGYIGSVTVEQLLDAGHDVVVLDNLVRGHVAAVDERARLITGNIGDQAYLNAVFSEYEFDAVMHFAADSQVGESVVKPVPYYANNLGNGITLIQTMLLFGIKKFVFSSTAALFGEPARLPIEEDDVKAPSNPYGRTKYMFEQFLADVDAAHGLKSMCLRYFNAAGASEKFGEDHTPETHLIPLILQVAAGKREEIAVFGRDYDTPDGTCIRDYIHVIDLAKAHILALEQLDKTNTSDRFNLGNGEGYSVQQVIDCAEKVTGRKIARRDAPRRPGDPASLIASSKKIRTQLDWKPEYPELESIIKAAWEWMQKHPDGYGDKS